jgi:hypothetical protein
VAPPLVISFLLLYLLWPTPRLARASVARFSLRPPHYLHDVIVVVLRAVGLLLFAVTLIALWFGSANSAENIAPTMIYVIFWVGVPLPA